MKRSVISAVIVLLLGSAGCNEKSVRTATESQETNLGVRVTTTTVYVSPNQILEDMVSRISNTFNPGSRKYLLLESFFVRYFYIEHYYTIDHPAALQRIEEYFGGTNFKVIWKWHIDDREHLEYLAVEEYPGIYKGIKKGIVVDELGKVHFYIDRDSGITSPLPNADRDYLLYNFKEMGLYPGNVGCIRLLYLRSDTDINDVAFDPDNAISIQLLNKELKVISFYTDTAVRFEARMCSFVGPGEFAVSDEELLQAARNAIQRYRNNQRNGLLFSPVNFIPNYSIMTNPNVIMWLDDNNRFVMSNRVTHEVKYAEQYR